MGTISRNRWLANAGQTLLLIGFLAAGGCASQKFTIESATKAAAGGDAQAEYFLAVHYARGQDVPQDYGKAAEYMRRSAEGGYAFAQNDLGVYYTVGRGVTPDPARAAQWFHKAAAQGDPLAEYSLGLAYFQGQGVPKDISQAIEWYHKSAEHGQPDAMLALGDIYLFGSEGIKIDYVEASKWYGRGAKKNNAACMNGLGFMYERGYGVPQNSAWAIADYRGAAEGGFVRAYANLGQIYLDGLHTKEDLVEAYKWFILGANLGDGVCRHYLMEMDRKKLLSEDQKQEAYRRVGEYQAQQEKTLRQSKV